MLLTKKIGLILIPIILIILLTGILFIQFNSISIIKDKSISFILTEEWRNWEIELQKKYLENLTQLNVWKSGFILSWIIVPILSIISISLIITPIFFKNKTNKNNQLYKNKVL